MQNPRKMSNKYSEFDVNLDELSKARENGVSGLLRVKDDAEFLEECIESCIPALDELVIIYGETNEESIRIIDAAANKYKDKIKVYKYEPELFIGNLSADRIRELMTDKSLTKHTLANYCNYALLRTTKKFVVKIDADQVYFTDEFKKLCDCYRYDENNYGFTHKINYWSTALFVKIASRLGVKINAMNGKIRWESYQDALYNRIRKYKCLASLSGVNVVYQNDVATIPLGECTDTHQNILPPYNGVGDTVVFRVTRDTYFEPYTDMSYETQNKSCGCLIERLTGVKNPMFAGLYWIHLNSHRIAYSASLKENEQKYPDRYLALNDFADADFMEAIKKSPETLCPFRYRLTFAMIHNALTENVRRCIESYSFDSNGYIRHRKNQD